jgi:hypothetical protein
VHISRKIQVTADIIEGPHLLSREFVIGVPQQSTCSIIDLNNGIFPPIIRDLDEKPGIPDILEEGPELLFTLVQCTVRGLPFGDIPEYRNNPGILLLFVEELRNGQFDGETLAPGGGAEELCCSTASGRESRGICLPAASLIERISASGSSDTSRSWSPSSIRPLRLRKVTSPRLFVEITPSPMLVRVLFSQ